jgi:hypothetical protein
VEAEDWLKASNIPRSFHAVALSVFDRAAFVKHPTLGVDVEAAMGQLNL